MKKRFKVLVLTLASLIGVLKIGNDVNATEGNSVFQVSPMNQRISLIPGERTYGTFKITNPNTNQNNFHFKLEVMPFTVDSEYNIKYENNGDYNQIVEWITLENDEAELPPNNTAVVHFYIDTPVDAPAGGQYAAIAVKSAGYENPMEGLNIQSSFGIVHALFAEVAGETVLQGDIQEAKVPSFLFSGQITGTSSIKNTGNVHGDAEYVLQVFPLFSKEEIFTNEEDSKTNMILPGATRTTSVAWPETPKLGIFHVIYTVNFEGVEKKIDKHVIICPIWLLIVILAIVFLILFKILFTGKKEKK